MTWTAEELQRIDEANDLHVAPFREDGETYGTPTWIWSVVVDDDLYVRAYNGQGSSWYQAAARERAGRIEAAGMTREVTFEPLAASADEIQDRIDQAYRKKYADSQYLPPMVSDRARGATVRITPRDAA